MTRSPSRLAKALFFDAISFAYLVLVATALMYPPPMGEAIDLTFMLGVAFASLLAGVGLSAFWHINMSSRQTLGFFIFQPSSKMEAPTFWLKTAWGWQLLILFLVTFVMGYIVTDIDINELRDYRASQQALALFKNLASPEWSLLPRGVMAIVETIYMAFIATVLAVPPAFLLAFFCAKNLMTGSFWFGVYLFLRTVLNVLRSMEPLIWAIIFAVWVGIGPFAGMLALMVHSIASLAKQYSELVECVEEGPIEGIQATGAKPLQVIWFAVVPQILLPYVSFTLYRWDINVRMATVIGLVGGGGIGNLLIQHQLQAMWREVGALVFLVVVAVWAMDTASAYIREAIK